MAEPYQEGKKDLWSMRSRVDGHDLYVSGWGSKKAAKKDMAAEVAKLAGRGKPKGFGPDKTTVGQALQDYGVQRLPFMKGAHQESRRINRYQSDERSVAATVRPLLPCQRTCVGASAELLHPRGIQ